MFIPDAWLEDFKGFVESRGGADFQTSTTKRQPDIRCSFRGSQIWAYKIPSGYQFYGENLDELEKMWKEAVDAATKQSEDE